MCPLKSGSRTVGWEDIRVLGWLKSITQHETAVLRRWQRRGDAGWTVRAYRSVRM